MRSGCPWRQLPKDLPALERHGLSLVCSLARCLPVREDEPCAGYNDGGQVRREASPSAATSTARTSRPRRLAARAVMMPARRSTGANVMRWLTRTGVSLMIEPHPASIQDRDGGSCSCKPPAACFLSSSGSLLMADMPANASPPRPASSSKSSPRARIRSALLFCRADGWSKRLLLPWIGRNRRLAKDFEASINSARAFLYAASVMLLSRRIARHA